MITFLYLLRGRKWEDDIYSQWLTTRSCEQEEVRAGKVKQEITHKKKHVQNIMGNPPEHIKQKSTSEPKPENTKTED